jgi:hypothetical protein
MTNASYAVRKINILTTASTIALVSMLSFEEPVVPLKNHPLPGKLLVNQWDGILQMESRINPKAQIIYELASKLIEKGEDLDPTFAKIVSKHFWDLL